MKIWEYGWEYGSIWMGMGYIKVIQNSIHILQLVYQAHSTSTLLRDIREHDSNINLMFTVKVYIYRERESGTPPGPQKYVVLSVCLTILCFVFLF